MASTTRKIIAKIVFMVVDVWKAVVNWFDGFGDWNGGLYRSWKGLVGQVLQGAAITESSRKDHVTTWLRS